MSYNDEPRRFRMQYRHCGQEWEDTWSCACNDKCPECGAEIEPYDYEEIGPRAAGETDAEIHSLLVASTAHVTAAEAKTLDQSEYARGETGWFFHVGGPDDPVLSEIKNPSEGLSAVVRQARAFGCAYVLLDRDAEQLEGVPAYDW